ncbi:hypothetical protein [Hoeflea alexandrii]|uniref:hypothetical protein n=1 Tax=Hoeflea alexandrii TaxID=288436 RepID=UPI0022B07379|nr:hypothetical protein [Hoeflea alexandrii]MCZ4287866.1 hypothetical protein [Hoeflea alexandrii]
MFAIASPFTARRERYESDGPKLNRVLEQVRVVGVSTDDDGSPAYVVEVLQGDRISLAIEPYLIRA